MHTLNDQFYNLFLFSFVAGWNASTLESGVPESFHLYSGELDTHRCISGEEYKYVVSVGAFEDKEREILIHKCLANMVSSWNAISSAYCIEHW